MTTRPFLQGKPSSFLEAFPKVKTLSFEGAQRGDASGEGQREERFSETNLPRVIACSNPRCQQGGYDLSAYIITLARDRKPQMEGQIYCNGYEGTPKGRRKGDACFNGLTFSITASFHTDSSSSSKVT